MGGLSLSDVAVLRPDSSLLSHSSWPCYEDVSDDQGWSDARLAGLELAQERR